MYDLSLQRAEEIEDLARSVVAEFAIGTPPVDPKAILRRWAVLWIPRSDLDAEAVLDLRERPFRLFVKPIGDRRERFTAAHEIGHFVLHDGTLEPLHRESYIDRTKRAARGDVAYCTRENEADAFAASLLMPAARMETDISCASVHYWSQQWIDSLTRKYQVSSAVLLRRFAWLRAGTIISGEAYLDSGRIQWVYPTAELEVSDPALAKAVWLGNELVPHGRSSSLPRTMLAGFRASNPPQREEESIALCTVFPRAPLNSRGELWVIPRNSDRVFFEIIVE